MGEEKIKTSKSELTPEIERVFENLPEEEKEQFIIQQMSSFMGVMRSSNPLFDKMDSQHINKFLDILEKNDEREYKNISANRWFLIVIIIMAIALFVFLTLFLAKDNENIYKEIIQILVSFAGGIGIGSLLKRKKSE